MTILRFPRLMFSLIFLFSTIGFSSVAEKCFVYYPTDLPVMERQRSINKVLKPKGLDGSVFGRYTEFIDKVRKYSPSYVIAPTSFGKLQTNYVPVLQFEKNDSDHDDFILLSLSKHWNSKNLSDARLGVVTEFDRGKREHIIQEIFSGNPKIKFKTIKEVPKQEDLFPLLVFNTVDVILIPSNDIKESWRESKSVYQIKLGSRSKYPRLYVRSDKNEIKSDLTEISSAFQEVAAPLGFSKLVKTNQKAKTVAVTSTHEIAQQEVHKSEKSKILVIRRTDFAPFDPVFAELKQELEPNFEVMDYPIQTDTTYEQFKERLFTLSPRLMILVDNAPTKLALKYNSEQTDTRRKIQGIAMMGVRLKQLLKNNREIAGIAYELPGYALITQFQNYVGRKVKNVLTFYRGSFSGDDVRATQSQLAADGIKLTAIDVEAETKAGTFVVDLLRDHSSKAMKDRNNFDAEWIQLDPKMVNSSLFDTLWYPASQESEIPLISGAENLVSQEMNVGVFAISPDPVALGGQAAQMVEAIVFNHISPAEIGVEETISVHKILNLSIADRLHIPLRQDKLDDIIVIK